MAPQPELGDVGRGHTGHRAGCHGGKATRRSGAASPGLRQYTVTPTPPDILLSSSKPSIPHDLQRPPTRLRYPMSTVTNPNPNQPAGVSDSLLLPPPAHVMSPRADAAPKSPRSEAVTLIGAGETLEERLQPTLKEAKLALDGAERAVRKLQLGIILGILALGYSSTVIMSVSAAMLNEPEPSVATSSESRPSTWRIAILIHGVLSFFTSGSLGLAYVSSELRLQQVHELKSFICELQGFLIANGRHYAVVDLEIEEKVAGYPRRLMAIMGQPKRRGRVEGGEQMGRVKTTVAAEKRKTEKLAV